MKNYGYKHERQNPPDVDVDTDSPIETVRGLDRESDEDWEKRDMASSRVHWQECTTSHSHADLKRKITSRNFTEAESHRN